MPNTKNPKFSMDRFQQFESLDYSPKILSSTKLILQVTVLFLYQTYQKYTEYKKYTLVLSAPYISLMFQIVCSAFVPRGTLI